MDKEPWNENEVNEIYAIRYEKILNRLLELGDEQVVLKFTPESKKALFKWQAEFTKQTNEAPEILQGSMCKLDTYAPRLCLLLQLLKWACDEGSKDFIDLSTVESALKLIEYFRQSAIKVVQHLNTTPVERLAENIRIWYESLPGEFRTSDAVAAGIGRMSERNVKYYLADISLFRRVALGKYCKIYA